MARQRPLNWTPVIVSSNPGIEAATSIEQGDGAIGKPAFSAYHAMYFDAVSEGTPKVSDRESQRRADLRFAIAVALVLALPAFIGLGIYIAAEAIIKSAS
jgi:hypothetical protein